MTAWLNIKQLALLFQRAPKLVVPQFEIMPHLLVTRERPHWDHGHPWSRSQEKPDMLLPMLDGMMSSGLVTIEKGPPSTASTPRNGRSTTRRCCW